MALWHLDIYSIHCYVPLYSDFFIWGNFYFSLGMKRQLPVIFLFLFATLLTRFLLHNSYGILFLQIYNHSVIPYSISVNLLVTVLLPPAPPSKNDLVHATVAASAGGRCPPCRNGLNIGV